ncbi:hypothetical protein [Rhodoligotrophos defluvii]|uniref:hypothetical protein n=1 Tax=Rhodoligotrophos defluvii TaxID=2561934 RepID=UPI0010C9B662|nr:hypothetical protein [Rhodoligotrophos defluvii]
MGSTGKKAGDKAAREAQTGNGRNNPQPGAIEWATGAAAALAVLAVIGFLGYQAFSSQTAVPRLEAVVGQIQPMGHAFHVSFTMRNSGDATAAGVLVRGRLVDGAELIEEREVIFDYVPAHAERRGGFIFQNDPRTFALQLQPDGYSEP